ncbi:MAG: hypothetical protein OEQ39_28750 [Gammaproteobacteria bacterium]|nr:hypothetical protein [Gammaproteobacteria bacterium]
MLDAGAAGMPLAPALCINPNHTRAASPRAPGTFHASYFLIG